MFRTTMHAFTRPMMQWGTVMGIIVGIIFAHQLWIAAAMKADFEAGGIGDPDDIFIQFRVLIYMVEGILLLISFAGLGEAVGKFLLAVQRRKKFASSGMLFTPSRGA